MTRRIFNAPPGLDYRPVTGNYAGISFGVVTNSSEEASSRTLEMTLAKRLYPKMVDGSVPARWKDITAERWDILLPRSAPDEFWDLRRLCDAYHSEAEDLIRDLAAIVTLRWPEIECPTARLTLHDAWETSRRFAGHIVDEFSVAAVLALHVPARQWARGTPHVHIMLPCRTIRPGTGFATFCKPLINPIEARENMDRIWGTLTSDARPVGGSDWKTD